MIGDVASVLSNRFIQVTEMVRVTKSYYEQMSATVTTAFRNKWEIDIRRAESDRLKNPSVMDVMGAKETSTGQNPIPSRVDLGHSRSQWLTLAMSIEERQ